MTKKLLIAGFIFLFLISFIPATTIIKDNTVISEEGNFTNIIYQNGNEVLDISDESDLNVNSSIYSNIWNSYDTPADILFSSLNWNFGNDWNYISGDQFYFNDSKLSTKYYNTTSLETKAGTPSGTLSDIQTLEDGNNYSITETNSVPGIDFRANFTNVDEFNQVYLRTTTNKNQEDTIAIQLWNYETSSWNTQQSFTYLDDYQLFKLSVFDGKYINSGEVQMRLYQSVKGKTTEEVYIDWISLAKGFGTPASEDLYYRQQLSVNSSNINDTITLTDDGTITIHDNYEANTDTQLTESEVENFIDGDETSFDGWDKDASDDFSGLYTDLDFTGTTGLSDGVDDYEADTNLIDDNLYNTSELEEQTDGKLGIVDVFINGLIDSRVTASFVNNLFLYNDLTDDKDTNASTECSGTDTYLSGYGTCETDTDTNTQLDDQPAEANVDMSTNNITSVSCIEFYNGAKWCGK